MSTSTLPDPLVAGTGRSSLAEAIAWIADEHPLRHDADRQAMLRSLVAHGTDSGSRLRALRRLAREVARSNLDSAAVLFETTSIVPAARFRDALKQLALKCPNKTLGTINSSAVIAAQRDNTFTVEALCAAAGLSYSELAVRVEELPSKSTGRWTPAQIRAAFELLDVLVRGAVAVELPGAVPARALELMPELGVGGDGWDSVEKMRTEGVPYEALLAQRAAGGSWLAHRNRTSSKLTTLVADRLCEALDGRGISYSRSKAIGGDTPKATLSALSGCDDQVGLIALDRSDSPAFGVIISSARDGGTARKNVGHLRAMQRAANLPVAVVVVGPGWAARNETAELAIAFDGRLYSEQAIETLALEIEQLATN